ncbi:polysaccharide deacetylase family protein [Paenibacillus sp. TAB 01]|uniref:polysaccharide deacetylase family protein n=1 Tax=Paenibacillus sp. TAB 01 TaxID=3368988 RepID=UPI0037507322
MPKFHAPTCLSSVLTAALLFSGCSPQQASEQPKPSSYNQAAEESGAATQGTTREADAVQPPASALDSIDSNLKKAEKALQAPELHEPTLQKPEVQQQAPAPQAPPAAPAPALEPAPKPSKGQQPKQSKPPEKNSRTTVLQRSSGKKRLTLSQLVKKYPDLLLLHGPSGSNKVALTFDDAPDTKYTLQVLDILKQYDVKATFFVIGRLVEKHPNVVKRMTKEGHVVGNHTYNHALLTKLSDEQFQSQILKTQKLLQSTIGYSPKLIRPPYGEITESQLLWASNHQMTVVNWNVDSKDWRQLSQAQVTSNVLNHAKAGSIILQHSGGGPEQNLAGTVSALPTIIESLQSRGYQLVTLPELLKVSKHL